MRNFTFFIFLGVLWNSAFAYAVTIEEAKTSLGSGRFITIYSSVETSKNVTAVLSEKNPWNKPLAVDANLHALVTEICRVETIQVDRGNIYCFTK